MTMTKHPSNPHMSALERRLLFLFVIISLIATGYRDPFVVDAMTGVARLAGREGVVFSGDPFAAAFAAFPSLLWPVVGWLEAWLPEGWLRAGLWVFSRVLLVFAFFRLGRVAAPRLPMVAMAMGAVAALNPLPLLGGGQFGAVALTHSTLAFPLLVLAISFQVQRVYTAAALLVSLCCFLQLLAVLHLLPAILLFELLRSHRRGWPVAEGALVAGSVLLAGFLFPSPFSADGESRRLAAELIRLYNPFHSDLFFFPLWRHLTFAVLLVGGMSACLYAVAEDRRAIARLRTREERANDSRVHRALGSLVKGFTIAAAMYYGAALLASVTGLPMLTFLQPMRGMDFWLPVALLAIIVALSLGRTGTRCAAGLVGIVVVVALCSQMVHGRFWWVMLSVPVIFAVIVYTRGGRRLRHPFIAALLAVVALDAAGQVLRRVRDHRGEGRSIAAVMLGAHNPKDTSGWGPPEDTRAAARAVAEWARRHAVPGETFAVPPSWTFFRIESHHPAHVLLFDVHAAYLDPRTAAIWSERLAAYGVDPRQQRLLPAEADALYGSLDDASRRRIAGEAPVHFWVLPPGTWTRALPIETVAGYAIIRAAP